MNFGKDTTWKLASCGETVRIWSLPNYDLLHEFSPALSSYRHFSGVSWGSDGSLVSVPAYGSNVTITRFPLNKPVYNTGINILDNVSCARFSADSSSLLLGCSSGNILSWNILQEKVVKIYTGHTSGVCCLHVNVNNTHVASGSSDGDIFIHNLVSGIHGSKLCSSKCRQSVRCIRFSTVKRSFLASSTDSGNVDIWDVNTMKPVHSFLRAHDAPATGLALSPINNMLVISAGLDKKIQCYSVNNKRVVLTLGTLFPLTTLDFFGDGRTFIVGTSQGHLMVYDLRGGRTPIKTFQAHTFSIRELEVKKFRMTAQSEPSDQLNQSLSLKGSSRSASSSKIPVVDYNSNVHVPDEIRQLDAADTSIENVLFSPIRDVPEMDVKTNSENRPQPWFHDFYGNRSNSSMSNGVFSPAREDQLYSPKDCVFSNSTPLPIYTTNAETIVEESQTNLTQWHPEDGIQTYLALNNQPDGRKHHKVQESLSSTQLCDEGTECLDKMDVEVVSRWQTSAPRFFTESVENLEVSYSSTNLHASAADSSLAKQHSTPSVKLSDSSKMENQSSISEKTDEFHEPNAQAFQTEFLKQFLEDELEDLRVKLQQPIFNVLAQVIKNHVEMKEEIQYLKDHINRQVDLSEEVKKLRAENQRLRMAF